MSAQVVALDVGGTDLKSALVAHDGSLALFARRPSRVSESAGAPIAVVRGVLAELRGATAGDLLAIGAGIPGVVDPASGKLVGATAHLPHWADFAIRETLEVASGMDVVVDNDANLAALAEHRLGAARGTRLSLTITLGTGVGCGIVENGRVLRGALGGAGEIGHLPLGGGALECECEVEGCVEPDMSGGGLARAARELRLEASDAEGVFALATRGDVKARHLIERFIDRLAATLAVAVNILNPEVVVIGGGVAGAGEALMAPLRTAIDRYALASHRRGLRLVPAALGDRAGVIGAGLLAWERVHARA